MIGPAEAQMIGRYFGNNSVYSAAAGATKVAFRVTSELEAAAQAAAQSRHDGHHSSQSEVQNMFSHAAKQGKATNTGLTDAELMQVLFAKTDRKSSNGPAKQ